MRVNTRPHPGERIPTVYRFLRLKVRKVRLDIYRIFALT